MGGRVPWVVNPRIAESQRAWQEEATSTEVSPAMQEQINISIHANKWEEIRCFPQCWQFLAHISKNHSSFQI